jgi:hypothetical protein
MTDPRSCRSSSRRRPAAPARIRRGTALLWALGLATAAVAFAGVFTPHATQPPTAYPIQAPGFGGCKDCHSIDTPIPGYENLPYVLWAGSMMANASRDPLFWAALDVANHDAAGVGDFCLRCHAPTGWYAGRSDPPGGTPDGCALIGPIDIPDTRDQRTDFAGVSCHLCHRMMVNENPPPGEQSVYYENGEAWLDDSDCGGQGEPCRRGPYDYPPGGPTPPPHPWAFSQYHVDADLCGNCHNVTSPDHNLLDETGADTGVRYPIERTFREWQASSFAPPGSAARTCQQCHMPTARGPDPQYACIFGQTDRAGELPRHLFVGGNAWVPRVLEGEYPMLNRDDQFDASVQSARESLRSAAAVAVTVPDPAPPGGPVEVSVRVTNQTGHKLPTGYPEGRRMWIDLEAVDSLGQVIWESGAWDPATGQLADDPQLKVYRIEPGIWNRNGTGQCDATDGGGNPLFHFVLNNCVRIDNRIPPLGFVGGSDVEIRPVAYTYPETFPGSGVLVNYDDTGYQIALPVPTHSPVTIRARLLYQTTSDEYVGFLRDQAATHGFPADCIQRSGGTLTVSRGQYLYDLWNSYDRAPPEPMAEATAVVAVGLIFRDGFDSGATANWSVSVP